MSDNAKNDSYRKVIEKLTDLYKCSSAIWKVEIFSHKIQYLSGDFFKQSVERVM